MAREVGLIGWKIGVYAGGKDRRWPTMENADLPVAESVVK